MVSFRKVQRRLSLSILALLGAACAPEEPPARTQILLVVDSDLSFPSELDEIEMEVEGPLARTQSAVARLAESPLPRSLGLVRSEGPLGPLSIRVIGRVDGDSVVERRATLSFVEGRTLVLPMHLVRACIARSCGTETCSERGCIDAAVDPQTLASWSGSEPMLGDEPREQEDGGKGEADAALDEADGSTDEPDGGATAGDAAAEDASSCEPSVEQCNQRDDDCDGVLDNGFNLANDPSNCGSCGNVCSGASRECCGGSCRRSC